MSLIANFWIANLGVLSLCAFATQANAESTSTQIAEARRSTLALFEHLKNKKQLLSGQFESWGEDVKPLESPQNHLNKIFTETGRWPGLIGLEYHANGFYPEPSNKLAEAYWRAGGLVQIYLILPNPAEPSSFNGGGHCRVSDLFEEHHPFHKFYFNELDRVAAALKSLQDKGVIVLLNPFPEAGSPWFWWNSSGPAAFKKLYNDTYAYLVNKHKLHNLLFVYEVSGQERNGLAFFPKPSTVDLVGFSVFVDTDKELRADAVMYYEEFKRLGKPLGFSQYGPRRGKDQTGFVDQPPADNTKILRAVDSFFPDILWWMNWSQAYAISSENYGNYNAKVLILDPKVVNRGAFSH